MLKPTFVSILMPSQELILIFRKYVSVVYDRCKKGSSARGNNEIHNYQILRQMLLCLIVNIYVFSAGLKEHEAYICNWTLCAII